MIESHPTLALFLHEQEEVMNLLNKRLRRASAARLLVFLLSATLFIFGFREAAFYERFTGWLMAGATLSFVFFLILVKRYAALKLAHSRADALHSTVSAELRAAEGDYSGFDPGDAPSATHPYAADLDVFGDHSLHRCVSRCHTPPGKKALFEQLATAPVAPDRMVLWHTAVKRLANERRSRLSFIAACALLKGAPAQWEQFERFGNTTTGNQLLSSKVRALVFAVMAYSTGVVVMAILGVVTLNFAALLMMLPLLIAGLFLSQTSAVYRDMSQAASFMQALSHALEQAARLPVEGELLHEPHQQLNNAQEAAADLSRISAQFDQRNNMFMALIANGFTLADVRHARRVVKWRLAHGSAIREWVNAIGRLELLCSLASFYDLNRGQLTFPEPCEAGAVSGKGLRHPLMLHQHMVANDLVFNGAGVMLITGANMAGKSTYLRTIGLNVLLARIGAPVAAEHMALGNLRLFTSMRTTDSIETGTSYFMAELKRLSELVIMASEGEPVLALLDEILKGTNSADKEAGSRAFVTKLLRLGVRTVVATHDVSLCTLEEAFPDGVVNRFFAAEVAENDLRFDYALRDGVCDTMNATWLMKHMKIVD